MENSTLIGRGVLISIGRVERDEYRRPKTYAVRVQFSLFLICWVERVKFLFSLFKSGFDDAMNMENENARFLMSSFC